MPHMTKSDELGVEGKPSVNSAWHHPNQGFHKSSCSVERGEEKNFQHINIWWKIFSMPQPAVCELGVERLVGVVHSGMHKTRSKVSYP